MFSSVSAKSSPLQIPIAGAVTGGSPVRGVTSDSGGRFAR